jgi:adenosylcobinamide kinase/adenosylcobinamide-phosphate guanylyltransferase
MQVRLLGTGSADGWPNPFCGCASCQTQRAHAVGRVSTSALVDGVLLLDLGPDTARQAQRAGLRLDRVRHVLVTHAHPDHWAPATLLWRQWARTGSPLTLAGPAPVVAEAAQWLGPSPTVRVQALQPGDTLVLDGYRVRALAADHEVECLLFDVTAPDGARLLYATDTGPLPAATVEALRGAGLDLLLLEQTFGDLTTHGTGHHDLPTFARTLADLRASGALTKSSRVVAVHLGHHNPPEPDLRARLAAMGAQPGHDGQVLETGPAPPPPAPAAPSRTLLLGGARSGKSAAAEALLAAEPSVVYVATSGEHGGDPEWRDRVQRHRDRRPVGWVTVETTALEPLLAEPGPPLLVDCLTLWLTAVLDEIGAWDRWDDAAQGELDARLASLRDAWRTTARRVVAVSNEVGSGVVPATSSGRLFRDQLGRLNAMVAAESESVLLLVAGLPVSLRGRPDAAAAPSGVGDEVEVQPSAR